jgi:hypothetical protein
VRHRVIAAAALASAIASNLFAAGSPKVDLAFGKLPLSFEPNRGQFSSHVRFAARGPGYSLFAQAYAAPSRAAPGYTDPSLAAGTMIKKAHIAELRAAVIALE